MDPHRFSSPVAIAGLLSRPPVAHPHLTRESSRTRRRHFKVPGKTVSRRVVNFVRMFQSDQQRRQRFHVRAFPVFPPFSRPRAWESCRPIRTHLIGLLIVAATKHVGVDRLIPESVSAPISETPPLNSRLRAKVRASVPLPILATLQARASLRRHRRRQRHVVSMTIGPRLPYTLNCFGANAGRGEGNRQHRRRRTLPPAEGLSKPSTCAPPPIRRCPAKKKKIFCGSCARAESREPIQDVLNRPSPGDMRARSLPRPSAQNRDFSAMNVHPVSTPLLKRIAGQTFRYELATSLFRSQYGIFQKTSKMPTSSLSSSEFRQSPGPFHHWRWTVVTVEREPGKITV